MTCSSHFYQAGTLFSHAEKTFYTSFTSKIQFCKKAKATIHLKEILTVERKTISLCVLIQKHFTIKIKVYVSPMK